MISDDRVHNPTRSRTNGLPTALTTWLLSGMFRVSEADEIGGEASDQVQTQTWVGWQQMLSVGPLRPCLAVFSHSRWDGSLTPGR